MSFKILVRGLDTDIGQRLSQSLEDHPYRLVDMNTLASAETPKGLLALFNEEEFSVCLNLNQPSTLDSAESEITIVTTLAETCRVKNVPLIQISNYRVYGEHYLSRSPDEIDFPDPEDDFGKSLVLLEQSVARAQRHITLRLSWLLDGKHSLFERTIVDIIEGKPLVASDHKFGRPLSVSFISGTLVALIQQILSGAENWGIFNLHSSDLCSEAEFCDHLSRFLSAELDKDLNMPEIAAKGDERSIFIGSANLQGRRITNNFGVQLPSWRGGFRSLLNDWMEKHYLRSKDKT